MVALSLGYVLQGHTNKIMYPYVMWSKHDSNDIWDMVIHVMPWKSKPTGFWNISKNGGGVPLNHPFFDGIFQYKPSILEYPHDYEHPQLKESQPGIMPSTTGLIQKSAQNSQRIRRYIL